MIDTTKWVVHITPELHRVIQLKSKEFIQYDWSTKATEYQIIKGDRELGSFSNKITIRSHDKTQVELEFSVPKQFLGNNIQLVYPNQLENALENIHGSLVNEFGEFPHIKTWGLQRLDLCYAWKYKDQETAQNVLNILKTFDYPRKSKFVYDTSVMWRGRAFSLKFYLKYNEYLSHDFNKIFNKTIENDTEELFGNRLLNKETNKNLACDLLEFSKGVLRFEISIRKESLVDWFGNKNIRIYDLVSTNIIEQILQRHIKIITQNLDKHVCGDREVINRLEKVYPRRKAIRLFQFYQLYTSPQSYKRQILKEKYNPSTVWRNKKDISVAKVGLPYLEKNIEFNLDIPSELVIGNSFQESLLPICLGGDSNTA